MINDVFDSVSLGGEMDYSRKGQEKAARVARF
jgi:hypothetical protein